jgi:hypothetical protein
MENLKLSMESVVVKASRKSLKEFGLITWCTIFEEVVLS